MVPAAFVVLPRLPLTANGKVDRQALPAPSAEAYRRGQYEPPQGEIELALAQIWQELLQVEQVGRQDDFFELGGHSLLAIQMVSRLRAVLECEISLSDVFEAQLLKDLAQRINYIKAIHESRKIPLELEGEEIDEGWI
jgi:acyl carrier protein